MKLEYFNEIPEIIDRAIMFATYAHKNATRKGNGAPYIFHPLEAGNIATSITHDREVITAAILHDIVEDTVFTLNDIEKLFGYKVASLVSADTEDKKVTLSKTETWKERKLETVNYLFSRAGYDEKIVIFSDKLSNLRTTYSNYLLLGDKVWERFNQKDKRQHEWYFAEVLKAVPELASTFAYKEYKELLDKLFRGEENNDDTHEKVEKYVEFHCHSTHSDGIYTPAEIIRLARAQNIKILAITDHNKMLPEEEFVQLEKEVGYEMTLIRGAEVSCNYQFNSGKIQELHVVVLFPEKNEKINKFSDVLEKNNGYDRRPYINAILDKLRILGMDLGEYDDLLKMQEGKYIGRPQIAAALVKRGYVKSTEEAMDEFIGDFGKKKAWVANMNKEKFIGLKELIDKAHMAQGLVVLCHLNYYKLNREEEQELLENFKLHAGLVGGIETEYRAYSEEQRKKLREYSEEFGLFRSAASDFHGTFVSDGLDNSFSDEIYDEMLKRWKTYYALEINN